MEKKALFRDLRADEVECRISQVKDKRLSLLLYKDARCDMNILDETFGADHWQREHYECKGNLFCRIGIKFGDEWIWKSDCGKESYSEKEKGESSDSFKRAGFNWGIGRELYTAPFIWIKDTDCNITNVNGKPACYDKFTVKHLEVKDKKITQLVIYNEKTKKDCYVYGLTWAKKPETKMLKKDIEYLISFAESKGVTADKLCKKYKVHSLMDLTPEQYDKCKTDLEGM